MNTLPAALLIKIFSRVQKGKLRLKLVCRIFAQLILFKNEIVHKTKNQIRAPDTIVKAYYCYYMSSFMNIGEIYPPTHPVKHLVIQGNSNINRPIVSLPQTLTRLELGTVFNQSIDMLPKTLKVLILGDHFNQTVDMLPESLKVLILGDYFNQTVDLLPESLKVLKIGNCYSVFDQTVDKLPSSLKVLTLGCGFSKTIDKLPDSLQVLELKCNYNHQITKLPRSLLRLSIKKITTTSLKHQ